MPTLTTLKKALSLMKKLQTTNNPHIYACGDVAATKGAPLTPVVSMEAAFVAKNVIGGDEKMIYPAIPSVVFTSPKLASIGISAEEAKAHPEKYQIKNHDTTIGILINEQMNKSRLQKSLKIESRGKSKALIFLVKKQII